MADSDDRKTRWDGYKTEQQAVGEWQRKRSQEDHERSLRLQQPREPAALKTDKREGDAMIIAVLVFVAIIAAGFSILAFVSYG